jgi:hypothetical protein
VTYNYINVEGGYSDGTYLPLSGKELKFTSSAGTFSGNSLFIDSSVDEEKVTIKVVVINKPRLWKETVIYIKKSEHSERLPTMEEVLNQPARDNSGSSRKKKKTKKNKD